MANSTKLVPFFQKVDERILNEWKRSITHMETIRERLENAFKKDTLEHKEIMRKELNK